MGITKWAYAASFKSIIVEFTMPTKNSQIKTEPTENKIYSSFFDFGILVVWVWVITLIFFSHNIEIFFDFLCIFRYVWIFFFLELILNVTTSAQYPQTNVPYSRHPVNSRHPGVYCVLFLISFTKWAYAAWFN